MGVTPEPNAPRPATPQQPATLQQPAAEPVLLPEPKRLGTLARLAPEPMKVILNWGRRYSLWVFNFGLACCAIEFIAASMARHDFIRLGVIPFAPGPRQADLMVVSGTVTDKMAPAVKRLYEQMPEPKYVISFGACSNCGELNLMPLKEPFELEFVHVIGCSGKYFDAVKSQLSGSCDPWAAANAAGAAAIIASASRRVKRIDTSNLSKLNPSSLA